MKSKKKAREFQKRNPKPKMTTRHIESQQLPSISYDLLLRTRISCYVIISMSRTS